VKQPVSGGVCQSLNRDGSLCKRPVHFGAKHCWQHAHGLRDKWRSLTGNQTVTFIFTVIGVVLAVAVPLEGSTVVGLLPGGPPVSATITGLRAGASSPNAAGCVEYLVNVLAPTDAVIDELDLTVQFPGNISSHRFGAGNSAVYPHNNPGRTWLFVADIGKDAQGECEIHSSNMGGNPSGLTETIEGAGMVRFHGVRIPPHTIVVGVYAMSVRPPSFQPASMYTEGHYEYQRLGVTVSKPLPIQDNGVQDAN
jgi:hypothetical protein